MTRPPTRRLAAASLCAVALAAACSPKATGDVLARVHDVDIGVADLDRFLATLPPQERGDSMDIGSVRRHLQTLVDRALLLREARRRGLDTSPEVQALVAATLDERLARQIRERDIEPRVSVSEAQVAEAFAARNWGRSLRVAHIFVRTDSQLAAVRAELADGIPFDVVARRHSQDPPSAARGGLMPNFYMRSSATAAVRDSLFALPVGSVSEPLPIAKGYEIFQVLEERPVAIDRVAERIRRELETEAVAQAIGRHLDSLAAAYGSPPSPTASPPAEATRLLARQARSEGLHERPETQKWLEARREDTLIWALREQAVAGHRTLTDDEVRRFYEAHPERYSTADEVVLVEVLLQDRTAAIDLLDRLRRLRDRAAAMIEWVEHIRQAVDEGRDAAPLLRAVPPLADAELRAFADWLRAELQTPVGRADFVSELVDAASSTDLVEHYLLRMHAVTSSRRPGSRESQGHYHIRYYDPGPFATLVLAAMEAGAGQSIGPIEVDGGFSVAKVLVADPRHLLPLSEVAARIRRHLVEGRESAAFHELLVALRRDAADEVVWFDETIRQAAAGLGREAGR